METKIERIGSEWKVTFTHGVQTFTLDYYGTKKECEWYKDRLDECFARAFGDMLEREKANELLPHVSNSIYTVVDQDGDLINCWKNKEDAEKHADDLKKEHGTYFEATEQPLF